MTGVDGYCLLYTKDIYVDGIGGMFRKPRFEKAAFLAGFLFVGIPYWGVPYGGLNLPNALYGPGLIAGVLLSVLLVFLFKTPFWRAVVIIAVCFPAAVLARVIVEGVQDPTSHNLWPLEIIIASFLGFFCALTGAVSGSLLAKIKARFSEDRHEPS